MHAHACHLKILHQDKYDEGAEMKAEPETGPWKGAPSSVPADTFSRQENETQEELKIGDLHARHAG